MKSRGQLKIAILAVLLAVFAFFLGYIFGPRLAILLQPPQDFGFSQSDWGLFSEVLNRIRSDYLEKGVNSRTLMDGVLRGLVSSLGDPYSQYLDPAAYEDWSSETSGTYGGIGIEIGAKDSRVTVISVFPNSPAEKAGIRSGDHFVKVEDTFVESLSVTEVANKVRGEAGTEVKLVLEREGQIIDFTLRREIIKVQTVSGRMINDRIGYIQLLGFKEPTAAEFGQVLDQLSRQGMTKLVLDIRQNPGGLLSSVIDVASYLIPAGNIVVIIQDRDGGKHISRSNAFLPKYSFPIVLLIDGGTASAAEILAGALRDLRLATLVGERSFGKGIVQTVNSLSGGGALILTTSSYLTPSGESIHKIGIAPDIEVKATADQLAAGEDPVFDKALEILTSLTP